MQAEITESRIKYSELASSNQRVRVELDMQLDLNNLPSDTALLHRLVREMASLSSSRDGEIERLQLIIKKLQRAQFGRRSERLDADQLALALEDLDGDIARIRESRPRS